MDSEDTSSPDVIDRPNARPGATAGSSGAEYQSRYPGAPPGWYRDPTGLAAQRWWNGYEWDQFAVIPDPVGRHSSYSAPYAPAFGSESESRAFWPGTRMAIAREINIHRMGQLAAFSAGAIWILILLLFALNATQMEQFSHAFSRAVHASELHRSYSTPQFSSTISLALNLLLPLWSASVIGFLVWQYRATVAARWLGYSPSISPGFGVGGWFIPILWYWIPYRAMLGCFPPGHPKRSALLRCWIALCLGMTFGLASLIAIPYSTLTMRVLALVAGVCWIVYVEAAPGIVKAIGAAHQEELATN